MFRHSTEMWGASASWTPGEWGLCTFTSFLSLTWVILRNTLFIHQIVPGDQELAVAHSSDYFRDSSLDWFLIPPF